MTIAEYRPTAVALSPLPATGQVGDHQGPLDLQPQCSRSPQHHLGRHQLERAQRLLERECAEEQIREQIIDAELRRLAGLESDEWGAQMDREQWPLLKEKIAVMNEVGSFSLTTIVLRSAAVKVVFDRSIDSRSGS